MSNSQSRRQRRYTLVNPELVQAEIRFEKSSTVDGMSAELREISQSDVKLLVAGPPELQLECRIELKSHRFKSPLLLPAEVHWARPNPAGDWLLGCHLRTPIGNEKIQELIDSGVLNRRASVRQRSRIPVNAQLQAGMPRLPAVVCDFSEGGLCLAIAEAAQDTRHVCVFGSVLGQEARIPLKIRWTLSMGPSRLIGCEFMRSADYQILRKLHVVTQKKQQDERSNLGSRANRLRIACGDGSQLPVEASSADAR